MKNHHHIDMAARRALEGLGQKPTAGWSTGQYQFNSGELLDLLELARFAGSDPCQDRHCNPFQRAVHVVTINRRRSSPIAARRTYRRLCSVHTEARMQFCASRQDLFESASSEPIVPPTN